MRFIRSALENNEWFSPDVDQASARSALKSDQLSNLASGAKMGIPVTIAGRSYYAKFFESRIHAEREFLCLHCLRSSGMVPRVMAFLEFGKFHCVITQFEENGLCSDTSVNGGFEPWRYEEAGRLLHRLQISLCGAASGILETRPEFANLGRNDWGNALFHFVLKKLESWNAFDVVSSRAMGALEKQLANVLLYQRELCVIHGDYIAQNWIFRTSGHGQLCILDFENASFCDPLFDAAKAAWLVGGALSLQKSFLAGFSMAAGFDESEVVDDLEIYMKVHALLAFCWARYQERNGVDIRRFPAMLFGQIEQYLA